MVQLVKTSQFRRDLAVYLAAVREVQDTILIKYFGEPYAALVPFEVYQKWVADSKKEKK